MRAHSRLLSVIALLVIALLLVAAAVPAEAETVKLRSGRELQVDEIRVKEDVIGITIHKDGGTARIDLRFERLDPTSLLALLDRYTNAESGSAKLRTARVALRFGLRDEAAARFRMAAAMDPALVPERDAALASIRKHEAADALTSLEDLLRAGADPRVVLTQAATLLQGSGTARFSAGQLLRITTLARLAQGLVERQQSDPAAGLVHDPEPGGPAPALPEPAPSESGPGEPGPGVKPQPDPKPLSKVGQRILAELDKARHARDAAADPKLSPERATRYLETAARVLLDSRRALQSEPDTFGEEGDEIYATLHALLVATYLDLADLYRQLGRYGEARATVRSALILDPGNEEAREQRLLIEDDLRPERFESEVPRGVHFYSIGGLGGCGLWPRYGHGYGHGLRAGYGFGGGGSYFAFRIGGGHHHHGGTARYVGRRR